MFRVDAYDVKVAPIPVIGDVLEDFNFQRIRILPRYFDLSGLGFHLDSAYLLDIGRWVPSDGALFLMNNRNNRDIPLLFVERMSEHLPREAARALNFLSAEHVRGVNIPSGSYDNFMHEMYYSFLEGHSSDIRNLCGRLSRSVRQLLI